MRRDFLCRGGSRSPQLPGGEPETAGGVRVGDGPEVPPLDNTPPWQSTPKLDPGGAGGVWDAHKGSQPPRAGAGGGRRGSGPGLGRTPRPSCLQPRGRGGRKGPGPFPAPGAGGGRAGGGAGAGAFPSRGVTGAAGAGQCGGDTLGRFPHASTGVWGGVKDLIPRRGSQREGGGNTHSLGWGTPPRGHLAPQLVAGAARRGHPVMGMQALGCTQCHPLPGGCGGLRGGPAGPCRRARAIYSGSAPQSSGMNFNELVPADCIERHGPSMSLVPPARGLLQGMGSPTCPAGTKRLGGGTGGNSQAHCRGW